MQLLFSFDSSLLPSLPLSLPPSLPLSFSLSLSLSVQSYGLIFVVDASSVPHLEEARETLKGVLQDNRMAGKPLLVFANKQDQDGAINENEVTNVLCIVHSENTHSPHMLMSDSDCLSAPGTQLAAVV